MVQGRFLFTNTKIETPEIFASLSFAKERKKTKAQKPGARFSHTFLTEATRLEQERVNTFVGAVHLEHL